MTKNRLEAFSDGVLAIIITIMVLEIKVPHDASWTALEPLMPVLVSYILSFVFVGIYWGNHHHLLHTVKHVSPGIIWSNNGLLFALSLIPFATGWMGENHFATNTVVVYAALLLLCGITFTWLKWAIEKTNSFSPEMTRAMKKLDLKGLVSVLSYGAAIPLAYVNTAISGALFVLVAVLWLIPDRNIERALKD
ncbi:MAG: DUF1211 domain-containing protein [Bacteroidetes bacterium]|nr:DUF1211 domain-containing protein [Bacteroidota bacterium]